MLTKLHTLMRTVFTKMGPNGPPVDRPSSLKTPAENFKTMTLLKRSMMVDSAGVWWKVETRQCQWTGIILRQTTRITD